VRRLLREVGRARRAMEQFAAAGERAEAFSVPLEDLPLFNAADAYALLTGTPGVDEILTRQMVRAQSA
jgi:hypothetical protein